MCSYNKQTLQQKMPLTKSLKKNVVKSIQQHIRERL